MTTTKQTQVERLEAALEKKKAKAAEKAKVDKLKAELAKYKPAKGEKSK